MKKIKTLTLSVLLIGVITITTAFALVHARSENFEEIETDNFIYTNTELLGLENLNIDWTFNPKGESTFEYLGFKYTRSNGFTGKIDNIEIINTAETIGIFDRIGNVAIYPQNLYESIDYTEFINVKNLIIGIENEPSYSLRSSLQSLPSIENIYYLNTSLPQIITSTTKNIILCSGLFISSGSWNGFNFPEQEEVKYITADAFKYTYLSYFEYMRTSFTPKDLGKIYIIPTNELPVPDKILPISPSVQGYFEYGGAIYSTVKDLLSPTGYQYGLVYLDKSVEKIVINQNISNYIATRIMVDTAYVIGDKLKNSNNLWTNHLIISYPDVFDGKQYGFKNNIYFYNTDSKSISIKESDLSGLTGKLHFPYFTEVSFPSGHTYDSYTKGSLLPEIKITIDDESIDTTDLTVTIAELKAELGINDFDIQGHPFSPSEVVSPPVDPEEPADPDDNDPNTDDDDEPIVEELPKEEDEDPTEEIPIDNGGDTDTTDEEDDLNKETPPQIPPDSNDVGDDEKEKSNKFIQISDFKPH